MSDLSNAFSLLELDVEDAKEHTMIASAADGDSENVKEQGMHSYHVKIVVPLLKEYEVYGLFHYI